MMNERKKHETGQLFVSRVISFAENRFLFAINEHKRPTWYVNLPSKKPLEINVRNSLM
jgi:hypothetical protein